MSDLLSAQSLLLAILAALFGAWSTGFAATAEKKPRGTEYKDNKNEHKKVKGDLLSRALPLALYAVALTLIMLPVTISILATVYGFLFGGKGRVVFDPIAASLVLVHLGIATFSIYLLRLVNNLWKVHNLFKELKKRNPSSTA